MQGHLVVSPLPVVADLAEAQELAGQLFAADAVPPFAPVFYEAPFGPIAVFPSGVVRLAEYIAELGTGLRKVVVA